jgi:hypothetical protein
MKYYENSKHFLEDPRLRPAYRKNILFFPEDELRDFKAFQEESFRVM